MSGFVPRFSQGFFLGKEPLLYIVFYALREKHMFSGCLKTTLDYTLRQKGKPWIASMLSLPFGVTLPEFALVVMPVCKVSGATWRPWKSNSDNLLG